MAYSFWSDKRITLTISKKGSNNSGISDIMISGSNGILCSLTELTNTANNIAGLNKTNTGSGTQSDSTVTFYASVNNPDNSHATGSITVYVKWKGPDNTEYTSDDTESDEHVISEVTIKNAVGNVKFSASNDLWITDATVSKNSINMNILLVNASDFSTSNENNYIYYTSREGDTYSVYSSPNLNLLNIDSSTNNLTVSKLSSNSEFTVSNSTLDGNDTLNHNSITILFDKCTDVSTYGYIDYIINGTYPANSISTNAKSNVGTFTGKLKNPISNIIFNDSEKTINALTTYDSSYNIIALWGGRPYSYDTSVSGTAASLSTQTLLPESNKGVGIYQFTPTASGTYGLTLTTTEQSAGNMVSGSLTIYVTDVEPSYTAPTARTGMAYNGSNQTLLNAGSTEDGTIEYSYDNKTFSTTLPVGKNAGTYTVYWRLIGDENHSDIASTSIQVTINQKDITITAASGSKTYDGTPLEISTTTQIGLIEDPVHSYTCTVTGSVTDYGTTVNTPSAAVIRDEDNNLVTTNYNITYVKGVLSILKREITVKADSSTKVYDGSELTKTSGCSVTKGTLADNQTITSVNTGSITNVGTSANKISSVTIKDASNNDVTSNYTVTYENGTLEITLKEIKFQSNSLTVTYDGESHVLTGATLLSGYSLVSGHTFTATNSVSGTNVSDSTTYTAVIVIKDGSTDVTSNYNISEIKSGTLTISLREITVTAASDSKTYDGTALTKTTGCLATNLVTGHTATSNNTGSATNYGDAGVNTITDVTIKDLNDNDVSDNYKITKATGKLTINKRLVTVTADSASLVYNTNTLTKNSATATNIVDGLHLHSYKVTGSQTNVGSSNNVPSDATVYSGTHGGDETNVTDNYEFEYKNGTLTVTIATPTLTLTGVNTEYDGTAHYATAKASVDGKLYYSKTSGVTTSNGIAVSLTANTLANVTSIIDDINDQNPDFIVYVIFVPTDTTNYNSITEKTISMNIYDAPVTLPTASNISVEYDALYHNFTFKNGIGGSITKYRYSSDNSTWTETTTNPAFINVGTKYVQAYYEADGNHSGSSWTTSVKMTITLREVKFISDSASYPYDGELKTINTAKLQTGYSLLSGHTFTVTNSVSATNVADSKSWTATIKIYEGTTDVTSNYNISEIKSGVLTINQLDITVTAGTDEKVYDNTALTTTATASGLISGHHLHSYDLVGSITYAGEVTTTVSNAKIYTGTHTTAEGSDVTDNYKITYVNGKLTITLRDITITAGSASKVYDETELTNHTYTITSGSLANNDEILSATYTGSLTNTGSSSNSVVVKIGKLTDDHTSSYNITYVTGTLTVTKETAKLTGSGGGTGFIYDGTEQGYISFIPNTDGSIYYTTDGSTPTNASTMITGSKDKKTIISGRTDAGTTVIKAILYPIDTDNYIYPSDVETVSVTIEKADPEVEIKPYATSFTYNKSSLNLIYCLSNLTGNITYKDSSSATTTNSKSYTTPNDKYTVLSQKTAGTYILYDVNFVPSSSNYNSVSFGNITVVIKKADLTLEITGDDPIYNKTSDLTLSGNEENGTVTWSSSNSSYVSIVGNQNTATVTGVLCGNSVTITATVAATSNYNSGTTTKTVKTVQAKDTPVFTDLNLQITWGQVDDTVDITEATANTGITYTLNSVTNSSGSTVSGFKVDENTGVLTVPFTTYYESLVPGNYTVSIKATSAGGTNYTSDSKDINITLTINRAPDEITISMEDITYGHTMTYETVTSLSGNYTLTWYKGTTQLSEKPTIYSDPGDDYKVVMTSLGNTYYLPDETATATFSIVIPYLILDINKLNYSKLK